jgi:drug/metabolite transporter (DMT)-like permease
MSQSVAAGAALAAALCFAVSSVCQHHAASRTPSGAGLRLGLLGRLLARPVWILGAVAGAGGVIFQVLALKWGLLLVVQPLLVTGLLFALPATMLVQRARPSLPEWLWAALLAAGLALFLLAARPHDVPGHPVDAPGALRATIVVVVLAALAVAAGALGKYCLLLLNRGLGAMLASWALWVLIVIVIGALVVAQAAFQAGRLSASLPPLTLIDPLVAVYFGVVGLSETVMIAPQALAGEVVGAVAMTIAVTALARRSHTP